MIWIPDILWAKLDQMAKFEATVQSRPVNRSDIVLASLIESIERFDSIINTALAGKGKS